MLPYLKSKEFHPIAANIASYFKIQGKINSLLYKINLDSLAYVNSPSASSHSIYWTNDCSLLSTSKHYTVGTTKWITSAISLYRWPWHSKCPIAAFTKTIPQEISEAPDSFIFPWAGEEGGRRIYYLKWKPKGSSLSSRSYPKAQHPILWLQWLFP